MCKGQRGDRGGPATPGKGGPTGPGNFGRGKGPGGAGAAPHPGGLTQIVQPRESSQECRGEGGSPGRGCLEWGGRDKLCTAQGSAPPPQLGRGWGGSPHLGGGAWSMGVPAWSWHPRGVWWRDIQFPIHPSPTGHDRWAWEWWGVVGAPHPLVQIGRGEFPPLHN